MEAGQDWVILILAGSSLLNAAYYLPVLYAVWFNEPPDAWSDERYFGRYETAWALLVPPVVTALLTLAMGLLASVPLSPLYWARIITTLEYLP